MIITKFKFNSFEHQDPWNHLGIKYYVPKKFQVRDTFVDRSSDSIFFTYHFSKEEDRQDYENSLPEDVKQYIVKDNF